MPGTICLDCCEMTPGGFDRCPECGSARVVSHAELEHLDIAHVDCDAFYASVEKRDRPELREVPLIVGHPGGRGVVTTACYRARQFGVRSAMPMFKARELCPDATIIPPDMAKYKRVSSDIRAIFNTATPQIEPVSLDEAYLDLSDAHRITGRIDIHDIGMGRVDGARQPIFVNTLYSCLAAISDTASFRPLWQPNFISALAPEDRCHLNGLAMDGERAAYVTAVSQSDVSEGWRERRGDGGVVIDVATGEVAVGGLSMPHSPRLYAGKLWLLNSGTGEFGIADPASGTFTAVCFCPGYARGLAFIGRHAVIGLSRPRGNQTYGGLTLERHLTEKAAAAHCGLLIVDIDTGTVLEWLRFEHTIEERYDVAVLPGVRQAEAIGFVADDIQREISMEENAVAAH